MIQQLYKELSSLPTDWGLVPVSGKQPLGGKGWNKRPYTPAQLIQWLANGHHCTGFGLLTGTAIESGRNYLLALDQDGAAAAEVLLVLAQENPLPDTVAFTSGRPGRCQRLFKVSADIAESLYSRKLDMGLELRFKGLMSVLPPSIHPITHKPYSWLKNCSPNERAIAFAPDWLIQLMLKKQSKSRVPVKVCRHPHTTQPARQATYRHIAMLLSRLHPHRADDYHDWIRVGMALYSHSPTLLPLWSDWSRQSSKYKPGECAYKWSTFNPTRISISTLYYLAEVDSPMRYTA
ncbi:bifunctional DNA primase/polymerase [Plectonema radiosum NIES-515]|uniref:Bifunctional DNA primase/polymerase n=1 Tax=Plectonema radiosum NIES-515 TaxID=2986073 RepID=A0ABT3B2H8_9CYAN|nr:bifunctional DNA primase/polymerase [Plectonema radiosum]MCV3215586.1 bifunctional DNA primase/polymerase [Plectonema radiosum NIES-515]